jgi:hypothetical protein
MPYIPKVIRERLDTKIEFLADDIQTVGDINYVISRIIGMFLLRSGISYHVMSGILGTLHAAANEFYARIIRPYEDTKITENGDVHEYEQILKKIAGKER